jgi:hypothetical protein
VVFSPRRWALCHQSLLCRIVTPTVLWQLAPVDVELSAFAYMAVGALLLGTSQALGPIIFKVGMAADPDHRFWNREYGYDSEREWHFMEVQGGGPANQMRNLEISLTAGLGGLPGCRNKAAGGEGVHPDRVHFQYRVVAPCGTGIGQQETWAMLRDAASPTKHRSLSHMLSVIGSARLAPHPHTPPHPPSQRPPNPNYQTHSAPPNARPPLVASTRWSGPPDENSKI